MEGWRTLGGGADKSEGSEQKDRETTGGRSSSSTSFVIPNGLMMRPVVTGRGIKVEACDCGDSPWVCRGTYVRTYTWWSTRPGAVSARSFSVSR